MELWCIVLICSLALAALCLLAYLLVLRHSLREAAEELDEKLRTDTNTLISISSGDRAMQSLVTHINRQLQALRRERLRLHSGNAELTAAFTNISHDLRTPLTVLCGYLDLLEQEPQTEAAARYLAVIRERTDAMRALTEELFRYSVLTATADELHTEPVCLNDVLEQSLAGFYGALSARGITPSVQLPEEKVIRPLDAAALRRVFDNILSNAAKYSDGDLAVVLAPGRRGHVFQPCLRAQPRGGRAPVRPLLHRRFCPRLHRTRPVDCKTPDRKAARHDLSRL